MCEMINNHYKLNVQIQAFEELNVENKFDVVSIITVLEHLYDPKKCIQKIRNLMTENGYLFIEIQIQSFHVPDILPDYLAFEHTSLDQTL